MNPDGSMVPVQTNTSSEKGSEEPATIDVNLGTKTGGAPAGAGDASIGLIKDTDTANFMQDVIEASMQVPVIVDFWAPWCGPCKQLGPVLEKMVQQAGGLIRMVKVNVDENQELAGQLRVQSIPAVFAFKDGQPVDGFSGAVPESQIRSFIDRLLGDAKPPLEQALDTAKEMLENGDAKSALELFRQIQNEDPENEAATAGVIRSLLALNNREAIDEIIKSLGPDMKSRTEVAAAISAAELNEAAGSATDTRPLRERVDAEPGDPEARFNLAMGLFANGQTEDAIDEFLELVKINQQWNDQAGRVQLLKVFDTLGPTHELTIAGRKRLSAILFS